MDLKVIQIDSISKKVSFSLGDKFEYVEGIEELVQLFIISLYNTPGKSLLFPQDGGGILNLLNTNLDINDKVSLLSTLKNVVEKTKNEITQKQSIIENPELKLRNAKICSLENGDSPDEISITIQIENENGNMSRFII